MRWLSLLIVGGVLAMRCGLADFALPNPSRPRRSRLVHPRRGEPFGLRDEYGDFRRTSPTGSSLVNAVTLELGDVQRHGAGWRELRLVQSVTLSILSPSDSRLKETPIATGHPKKPGSNKLELDRGGRRLAAVRACGSDGPWGGDGGGPEGVAPRSRGRSCCGCICFRGGAGGREDSAPAHGLARGSWET